MPLNVYGLMCPVCLASLHHLVDGGELRDPRGDDSQGEGAKGQLPLISSFSHPLESHRFRRLQASLLVLDVLRKARTLQSDMVLSEETLEAYPQRDLNELLGGMARYYGCGDIAIFLGEKAEEIEVLGDWKSPHVIIPQNLAVISSEQELAFLVIAALYPLFAGTLALVRLAAKLTKECVDLTRWLEAVHFSADRFAAAFYPSPALWLRARLKCEIKKGDKLVSLIDELSIHFPKSPANVAKLLKGRASLLRRLLEMAEFHKSDIFTVLARRELVRAAFEVPLRHSELSDDFAAPSAGDGESPAVAAEQAGESPSNVVSLSFCKSAADGPTSGPSTSQPNSTADSEALANSRSAIKPSAQVLSAELLYLSSFRNELCVALTSLKPFHIYPLDEWCRHPRYVTFDMQRSLFYISDFEISTVFAMDVHGRLVGQRGEKGRQEGQLLHPTGLAVDDEGNLWVADSWNDRLLSFSAEGEHRATVGGFNRPMAIRWDPKRGGLWVADMGANQIVKTGAQGDILFSFGKGELAFPETIDLDSAGNVLVADTGNGLIKRYTPSGSLIGVIGRGGLPGERPMRYPQSLAVGPKDEIVIAERGGTGLLLFLAGNSRAFPISEPLPDGHGCGFPCDLHVFPNLIRAMGKAEK